MSLPFLLGLVPLAVLDIVARLDKSRRTESLSNVLKILLDLAARGVEVAPVRVRGKRVLV